MSLWRMLPLGTDDAFRNMAVDEAILSARVHNLVPDTLRFYKWKPSAVSLGRFQKVDDYVWQQDCKSLGVDLVRRISGGGAVYHDEHGEITYSIIASEKAMGTEDIGGIYERIYMGLAEGLKSLGVTADYCAGDTKNCPNLTVAGRKISGSSQAHRKGIVLQHGTVLLRVDLEKMFHLLRVSWTNSSGEIVRFARNRITSVEQELKREVTTSEAVEALKVGFCNAFEMSAREGRLTSSEIETAYSLENLKYRLHEWNLHSKSMQEE